MIPARFDYARPTTLAGAHLLLQQSAPNASVALLAGGQSLLSELKLRRSKPDLVVDLGRIEELRNIESQRDTLTVGAMSRQSDFAVHPFIDRHAPIFREVAAAAGDPMIRRKGTLVGAFCAAEPGGDWAAAGLVHDVDLEINRSCSTRIVTLEALIALSKKERLVRGDIVTKAILHAAPEGTLSAYRKCKHAAIGWSIASIAVVAEFGSGATCTGIRLAASGALVAPQRLRDLEAALGGIDLTNEVATDMLICAQTDALEFTGDRYASATYRKERLVVLIRRTLAELGQKALSGAARVP